MDTHVTVEEAIKNFRDNMESLAQGSYLNDQDKELWEAPYPLEAARDMGLKVQQFVDHIRAHKSEAILLDSYLQPNSDYWYDCLAPVLALNDHYDGALLEEEEVSDLLILFHSLFQEITENLTPEDIINQGLAEDIDGEWALLNLTGGESLDHSSEEIGIHTDAAGVYEAFSSLGERILGTIA